MPPTPAPLAPLRTLTLAAGCLLSLTSLASAQPQPQPTPPPAAAPPEAPSPVDVLAASNAFAEGQRAQLRGDHARAADLFELANATAPSAAALRSAMRNHRAAGHAAQAASDALEALSRYGEDGATVQLANGLLAELAPGLTRLTLECAPDCTITLDGRALGSAAFSRRELFVEPGSHTVRAAWPEHAPAEQRFDAVAGQAQTVHLDRPAALAEPTPPPAPLPAPAPVVEPPAPPPPAPAPPPRRRAGLPPVYFWAATGLTAVATGLAVWSGMDTLSARDEYVKAPTRARYDDGVTLELRTNALFVTSAVVGVATVALGLFFTDWGMAELEPVVALGDREVTLGLAGPL